MLPFDDFNHRKILIWCIYSIRYFLFCAIIDVKSKCLIWCKKPNNSSFKLYMGDTGLLISHAFDENGIVSEEIYKKLLFGKLEINEGKIFENIVAQMLVASGRSLYFTLTHIELIRTVVWKSIFPSQRI